MQAVILAGGEGTRLSAVLPGLPKPLAPLLGLPVLDHLLGWLAGEGVTDVVLCTAFRADLVEAAIGDGTRHGLRIRHRMEAVPLGTAGAVKAAADLLDKRFFVVYGDTLADVDLRKLLGRHLASGAEATLAVHPNDHPFDSDRVVAGADGRIERMVPKEGRAGPAAGALCNAALYVLERHVLDLVPTDRPSDFARDLFPALLAAGRPLWAHRTTEYIKDMGTPERLRRVEAALAAGLPRALRCAAPKAAILLDRDGVLNEDVPYITRPDQLKLLPGAALGLKRLNDAHVLAVCCTNQPVVARGELSPEGLHALHRHLEGLLGAEGAWLDAIHACPHHPDKGFEGERVEYKVRCECRKPEPGLLLRAIADLGIDRAASLFVGDRPVDLLAAERAGVLGIGVLTGAGCRDTALPLAPERLVVPALADAVALLLDTVPSFEPWLDAIRRARVVCIGGASRAGKTWVANALRLALHRTGTPTRHLSLDSFILPLAERTPGQGVAARIRWPEAAAALAEVAAGSAVLLPGYDPRTRSRSPGKAFAWNGQGVLIADGLLATAFEGTALKIAMHAAPEVRASRAARFRDWKLASSGPAWDREAADLQEEEARVAEAAARADLHLTLDSRTRLAEAT